MTTWDHARFHSSPVHSANVVSVDARANIVCAQGLLGPEPHPMCLEEVQPWTTFSCAQYVPWLCGKAVKEALPGPQGWTCSSACIVGFAGGI